MKQKTAKNTLLIQRHPIIILVSVLAVTFAVILIFRLVARPKTVQNPDSSIVEGTDKKEQEKPTETTEKSEETDSSANPPDETSDFDSPKPTYSDVASSLSASITFADVLDGELKVYSSISVLTSGTCRLTLSAPNFSATYDSEIIANPSSSACATFSLPAASLPSPLTLTLDITTTTGETTTITKEIEL